MRPPGQTSPGPSWQTEGKAHPDSSAGTSTVGTLAAIIGFGGMAEREGGWGVTLYPVAPDRPVRDGLLAGVRAAVPVSVGLTPFGLLSGATAVAGGFPATQAIAASVLVFAGTSQIAAFGLLASGSSVALATGTALLLNARFLLFGASLAPHLATQTPRRRLVAGYLLTTQAYAVAAARYDRVPPDSAAFRWGYFLGAAAPIWCVFQLTTVAGALAGTSVDAGGVLALAIPLSFLALLVPAVTDRRRLRAAVVAAAVAVVAHPLPANLGMVLAVVTGIVAGVLTPAPTPRPST